MFPAQAYPILEGIVDFQVEGVQDANLSVQRVGNKCPVFPFSIYDFPEAFAFYPLAKVKGVHFTIHHERSPNQGRESLSGISKFKIGKDELGGVLRDQIFSPLKKKNQTIGWLFLRM